MLVTIPEKIYYDLCSYAKELEKQNDEIIIYLKNLDCGSSACRYALDKTGQRTNGGCYCLNGVPTGLRIIIEKIWMNHK